MKTSHTPSTRRNFLKTAGTLAGGALAFPQIVSAQTLGLGGRTSPNNRINIGLIGCGGRGFSGSFDYVKDQRTRFAALCDPNPDSLGETLKRLREHGQIDYSIPMYSDFRDVLRRSDIDAVHIATADHWHVPIALAAARAGKDIYCEKPLGLSVEQCLACEEITAQHNRVFQYGTQNRSLDKVRLGIQMALNDYIGKVRKAVVWAPMGISGGFANPVLPVPEGFDYNMWLGPAPEAPFTYDRCLRRGQNNGIYHIYDYAIGFIAGWGAHPLDQYQWWADHMGLEMPVKVEGTAKIPSEGLFNTITHWDFTCTYANGFEMRFLDRDSYYTLNDPDIPRIDAWHGSLFLGEDGWINVNRGDWHFSSETLMRQSRDEMDLQLHRSTNHCRDFVDAIVSRKQPVSNLQAAIRSDIICHLCDISTRLGRPLEWDDDSKTIRNDREAVALQHRDMREPWGLDLTVV